MGVFRFFRRAQWDEERATELEDYLARERDDNIARGMTPDEAGHAARRKLGSPTRIREEIYEMNTIPFLDALWQDLRYSMRLLRRNPIFALTAILTLALGIGANAAIFSLVDGILLLPLPYTRPEQLVSVTGTYPRGAFVAMRDRIRTMDVAAYSEGHDLNLTGHDEPVRLTGTLVSAGFFTTLGVTTELGRTFRSGEDRAGADGSVILSHSLWEYRFNRDSAAVGRTIQLDGISREIVGVMPANFRFGSPNTQFWIRSRTRLSRP